MKRTNKSATKKAPSAKSEPSARSVPKISWAKLFAASLAVAFVGGMYCINLTSFAPATQTETIAIQAGHSLSRLSDNMVLAPYKLLVYGVLHLPGNALLDIRIASVIVTCVSVWLIFLLARKWYGTLVSVWVTVAFSASSWILHTSRSGTAYSYLLLTIIALLYLAAWLNSTTNHNRAVIVFALVSGLALFTPGGIWFVIAITLLLRKPLLIHRSKATPKSLALAAAIYVALLVAIGLSLIQNTQTIAQWAGLAGQGFPSLLIIAKQTVASVSYFVIKGPVLPESWLSHTPLLDVASSVFLLFGVLFYSRHLRNARTRLLLSFAVICVALIALNGPVALNYGIPVVYLILGGGVAYVIHQWNRIFPCNPIARSISVVLMTSLLIAIVGFHSIRYFVAWRHSPNTDQLYSQTAINLDDPMATSNKIFNHLIQ